MNNISTHSDSCVYRYVISWMALKIIEGHLDTERRSLLPVSCLGHTLSDGRYGQPLPHSTTTMITDHLHETSHADRASFLVVVCNQVVHRIMVVERKIFHAPPPTSIPPHAQPAREYTDGGEEMLDAHSGSCHTT